MPADLIVTNAKIYTMDPARPTATAFAVRDGQFLIVGNASDVAEIRGEKTEVIDLDGHPVLPGLCDAHIHFTAYALSLSLVNLFEVPSLVELQHRVAEKVKTAPPGAWLKGFGWNHTLWSEQQFPTRHDLDQISSEHPLYLTEKSGHAAVVNSLALKLAGLNDNTPDPAGGKLARDANGTLTGLLLEDPAMKLVNRIIPKPSEVNVAKAVKQAQKLAHKFGLTAIHDLDGRRGFIAFQQLRTQNALRLRTVSHIAMDQLDDALGLGLRAGLGDQWLRTGGLKLFADGALGPRTAAMLAPYQNEPDNYGITVVDKEDMVDMAKRASAGGLPTIVHAIGDRANHDVLDVFEAVRRQEAAQGISRSARRHRMEHVQLLHPDDLGRLAALDVIASVQPIHATQDMVNVDAFWGRRGQYSYAFRSLLNKGTRLAFGSDAPIETPNPFVGIHAAVTRRRADGSPGPDGWHPEQRLTVTEAVAAYTTGAAYAENLEDQLGSISPGKYADFIVIDRDIFTCDPMDIKDAVVEMTVIGGKIERF